MVVYCSVRAGSEFSQTKIIIAVGIFVHKIEDTSVVLELIFDRAFQTLIVGMGCIRRTIGSIWFSTLHS